jgi:hypothetical protein
VRRKGWGIKLHAHLISPIGTAPPRASWISRPMSQQTLEKVFHEVPFPPSDTALAGSQFSRQECPPLQGGFGMFVASSRNGFVQSV